MPEGARILIIEARFYEDITDNLVRGCVQELTARGAGYKRVIVPGILEIPAVIRYAVRTMEFRATDHRYSGYVVLGCAIKGETDHYEHVCREAMGGVSRLVIDYSLALGNAILACPTRELALERSRPDGKNLGGKAARTCLRMIEVKREMGL
ncbi:6,7-dimethyl-8-ribityllumazine synthase [uncultured Rhodospira sp.]|uniref:6,7-dimethyl-8-ribityllumazine synthase n=1 Tax=uncultured Rhodospira sp. TaxID=1936189 RepID=UPI00260C08EE|nr:6,7-dimethyl-8-ribityllumazine synthase [uncultured Rhodospira sp.]